MSDDTGVPSPALQYEQALRQSGLRLAFAPAIEADYLHYKDEQVIPLLRFGFGVGTLLYAAFFVIDYLGPQRLNEPWMLLLVFGIASPATAAPALATLVAAWRPYARRIALWAAVINGCAIAGGVLITAGDPYPIPYQLLLLNVLYVFFMYGILFRVALPLSALVVGAYLVLDAGLGYSGKAFADHVFILLGFTTLCAIATYLFERTGRRSWLRAQLVQEMALRDGLTGLFNRRHLYEQSERLLGQATREHKPLGLLMLDVDYFKGYNDSQGHLAGDQCLRAVAADLLQCARRPLDLVIRLGGEEFVIVLFDIDREALAGRAEELRQRVAARAISHPASPLGHVTVSVGAVASMDAWTTLDVLLATADRALYTAKSEGRNCVRMAGA